DHSGSKRWLRTGDIGVKKGLTLWIMGRQKDLFKVNGENLLADDVEIIAASVHPNLNSHGAAAFRVNDHEDNSAHLLIETYTAFEREVDKEDLIGKIKSKVFATLGLRLDNVFILKRGTLERTSSGKIKRNAIAADFSL